MTRLNIFTRRLKRDENGAVLIEMGLVLSVLVLFFVAVYDLGGLLVRETQITNAVRAGTQYALVRKPVSGDVSQVLAAVLEAAPDQRVAPQIGADLFCACPDGVAISCNLTCDDGDRQSFIRVSYEDTYNLLFRYPGFSQSVTLRDESIMRLN